MPLIWTSVLFYDFFDFSTTIMSQTPDVTMALYGSEKVLLDFYRIVLIALSSVWLLKLKDLEIGLLVTVDCCIVYSTPISD